MKTLTRYINEKLVINKDFQDVDTTLTVDNIKNIWGHIFDDIKELKTGNIRLGKIKLDDSKVSPQSSYRKSIFTLYTKTPKENEILIRRTIDGRPAKWIVNNEEISNFEKIDKITGRIKTLLTKEGYVV